MLNEPVELLVCKMAVPTIITMLTTALYNMADTYFVGQLDTVSTAAVGLALPLMNIIQAIGFFFGHGSGNYMSRKLGAGDYAAAEKMADTAAIMSMSFGFMLTVLGMIFLSPLNIMLGATPLLMESSKAYISVLLLGIPFSMTSFTLNNQLRCQGLAFKGMIGMAGSAVLNVILDPVFIFTLDMGVSGGALATIISQIASFVILMKMSGRLPLRKPCFELNREIIGAVFCFGTPSLVRQSIMSIAAICLNNIAGLYGEAVIAAISVVNKIVMFGASVIIGFGQGFQPVCGFNSGAKRHDRVLKMFIFCIKAATVFMTLYGIAAFAFAAPLIALFRDDPLVIEAGTPLLRYQCITMPLQGVVMITNMLMQNLGKTFTASFLAVARQGIFFIPLLYLFSHFLGLTGVLLTQSAADLLTAVITIPITISAIKKLKSQAAQITEGESV